MAFSTEPSQLPIGTTKVVASAVDANDNMGSCTFHVTVELPTTTQAAKSSPVTPPPTPAPTAAPTSSPTAAPTSAPTASPTTAAPTATPPPPGPSPPGPSPQAPSPPGPTPPGPSPGPPPDTGTLAGASSGSSSPALVAGAAAGGVAFVALLLVLFLARRRRAARKAHPAPESNRGVDRLFFANPLRSHEHESSQMMKTFGAGDGTLKSDPVYVDAAEQPNNSLFYQPLDAADVTYDREYSSDTINDPAAAPIYSQANYELAPPSAYEEASLAGNYEPAPPSVYEEARFGAGYEPPPPAAYGEAQYELPPPAAHGEANYQAIYEQEPADAPVYQLFGFGDDELDAYEADDVVYEARTEDGPEDQPLYDTRAADDGYLRVSAAVETSTPSASGLDVADAYILVHHLAPCEQGPQWTTTNIVADDNSAMWRDEQHGDVVDSQVLGTGAFGVVIKGKYKRKLDVAIKFVGSAPASVVEQEVAVLRGLQHPNLIRTLGLCSTTAQTMIVIEFADGGSLEEFCRSTPVAGVQPSQLRKFLRDAALGLAYLHSSGLVHRDLACRNVLLSYQDNSSGVAKITDFGLARTFSEGCTGDYYSLDGSARGEVRLPWWQLSPECINQQKFGPPADCYSFGLLIWEVWTLSPAIDKDTPFPAAELLVETASTLTGSQAADVGVVMSHLAAGTLCPADIFAVKRNDKGTPPNSFVQLAQECLSDKPTERPTAELIAARLGR
eukprot:m.410797 g.410797  ORF g.410797 m.410797 type:complete len:728 (+) comp20159_c0_seq25:2326-4509(+)